MVTPGPKTSTFPSSGKSTSTRATSGRRSVIPPTVRRQRSGSWAAKTDSSQSTSSWCRTAAPIERKTHERLQAICARLGTRTRCKSLRRKPRRKHHGQEKERLEANPSQPPPGHSKGLCGARTRRVVELN